MKKIISLASFALLLNLVFINVSADGAEKVYLCQSEALYAFRIVGYTITVAKIVVPLIIVILASLEFGKAVMSGDQKDMDTSLKKLVYRFIFGVIIFIIPTLLNTVIDLFSNNISEDNLNDFTVCTSCVLDPTSGKCTNEINDINMKSDLFQ